jgi:hypothetical protein
VGSPQGLAKRRSRAPEDLREVDATEEASAVVGIDGAHLAVGKGFEVRGAEVERRRNGPDDAQAGRLGWGGDGGRRRRRRLGEGGGGSSGPAGDHGGADEAQATPSRR